MLSTIRQAVGMTGVVDRVAPESMWASPNHLYTVEAPENWPAQTIGRTEAMRVPAIVRARKLIVANIARCPLVAADATGVVTGARRPLWLDRTDGPVSPFHRMLLTCDDLFFHGYSAWAVERDGSGVVVAADRIPFEDWSIGPNGRVLYRETEVDARSVVVIPGESEGILNFGSTPIRHARDLAAATAKAATTPATNVLLKQTSGDPLTREKAKAIVDDYVSARREADHGVSFASANIDVIEAGKREPALFIDGRNAAAVDIARLTGVPASLLDAATPGGSMTYKNTEAKIQELIDFALAPYMSAIAARLGMDDMVPAGVRIEFDTTVLTGVAGDAVSVPDDGPAAAPTPLSAVPNRGA